MTDHRSRVAESDGEMEAALVAADGAGRFRLRGDVGFANARHLWEQGKTLLTGVEQVEIDLSAVGRTDSAGVALLVAWTRQARSGGMTVRFVNIPAQMRAIAGACGVEAILPFSDGDRVADNNESNRL